MNIFVGNLAREVSDQELEKLFAQYGHVKSVKIIRDLFSGESKGFAFVDMPGKSEAAEAMNALNTYDLKGKKITVNEARPKTQNTRGGGGGGNRGRSNGNSGGGGFSRKRF